MGKNIQNFSCKDCDYNTSNVSQYNKHLLTLKHKNNTNNSFLSIKGDIKNEENSNTINAIYSCDVCNFQCKYQSNYDKHLLTEKHKKKSNEESTEKIYTCSQCNKEYLNYKSLWKHKKHCVINNNREPEQLENTFIPNNVINTELIMEAFKQSKGLQEFLVEQNRELQNKLLEKENQLLEKENQLLVQNEQHHKQIIELTSKQIGNTNINSHNTHNNQFNLQFFLNETCKDAMNIVDFVNSLQVQIADLEKTGKLGYVEGISSIFLKGLKQLDISMRPIHCTDLKRETVYVKDEDNWNKEDEEKAKMKLAIERIARKNLQTLPKWQQENPDFRILDTNENNDYLKIALNSLGGQTDEEQEKYIKKIMKNVLKEVVIEKK